MDERNGGGSCVRCCLRGVLWGLVPLALIVAGAWFANRDTVEETLRRDVEAALRAAGIGWAGVEVAGRDVTLTGAAPSRATIAAARRAALAVRGVRRVNAAEVEIRPELPGVRPLTTAKPPLILRGTWPAAPGTELTVTVAGRTYRAGDSPALTVHDGEWTLRLEKLPPDGVYEVEVTVRDGAVMVRDSTRHELVVDTTPPARPGIETVSVQGRAAEIAGTWPAGDARTLVVAVDGHVWKLGESPALEAENGRWRLRTGELPEGSHDVTVTVADAVGNTASTTAAGAVVVDTTPPPPAVVDSVKVDGRRVTVTGRWPAAEAKALMVSLAGHSYWLGDTPELTADGERWTLRVENVPEGAHDIVVAVTDAAGNRTESRKEKAVRVDTTPPPVTALAIDSARLEGDTAVLEGRWPQGDAVTLEARLGERTHHLGEGGDFRRAGDGRWRLRVRGLTPGRHDLTLIQRDAAGNESRRTFSGVIAVPVPRPTPRPQPAEEEKQPKAGGSDAGQPTMPEKQGKADRARPAPMATRPADTTPPPAPVVPDLTTNRRRPVIVGRWPAAEAVALEAELDGRILTPRPGGPLTVTGDVWRLQPPRPLKDGVHTLRVTVRDAAGNGAQAEGRIVVDTVSPPPPRVRPLATQDPRPVITGTWPAGDAVTLQVEVGGGKYVPRTGGPLTVEGRTWRLALPRPLAPGAHDVRVLARDAAGNIARDQTVNELVIKAPPRIRAPEKVAAAETRGAGLACQKRLDERLKGVKIMFESDSARIRPGSRPLIAEIARILNTCPKARVLVAGHTDSTGSATYNQALSERRAAAVARALIGEGVAPSRLEVVGFGEARPVADNATEAGRARNRRIEFIARRVRGGNGTRP